MHPKAKIKKKTLKKIGISFVRHITEKKGFLQFLMKTVI